MKITYTDMQDIAQEIIGLTDATTLLTIKNHSKLILKNSLILLTGKMRY